MIYLLVIWRNLCQRPLQSLMSLAVAAGSIAVTIIVMLLSAGVHEGLIKAAQPFDLIVGAKGSPNQLVLNTVFLQDAPIGNVREGLIEELKQNSLTASVIPMGFGDNYHGFRIIGTTAAVFSHRMGPDAPHWLQLQAGREFAQPFEAVLGAKVAAQTGLNIGDTFSTSHGVVAGYGSDHQEKFTVTGVLADLGGPYDSGILVSLESIWQSHASSLNEENKLNEGEADRGVTAILVKPRGYAEALTLYQQFQKSKEAQLIFPSQVVVNLFAILGEGERIFRVVAGVVLAMAMLMIAVSLYWSALSRARDHAILRVIGAGRRELFFLIFGEGFFVILASACIGTGVGHGIFFILAKILQKKTALSLSGGFTMTEGAVILAILTVGMFAAALPAARIAKRDLADEL